ncbi:MAG: hypothetical protein ABL921_30680 [Pirellula sp.]
MKVVRKALSLVVVVALSLAMASTSYAQRGGGGARMLGTNRVQLCSLNEVQSELKLTDDQKKIVKEVYDKYSADVRDAFQNAGGDFQGMMEKTVKLANDATPKVVDKLDDAQKKRLTQIFVQANGGNALFDVEVQKSLKVTEEQSKKLASARTANREEMMSAFGSLQGASAEERQKKMADLTKTANEKLMACISADQVAEFEKMGGAKIELDLSPLMLRRPNN